MRRCLASFFTRVFVSRKRSLALLVAAVLGIAVVGAACDPAPPPPSCGPAPGIPTDIYNQVNDQRAYAGLPRLGYDCTLGGNAQSWANAMAFTGNFAHQNLSAVLSSPAYSNFASLGENILVGAGSMDAKQIDDAWMASPPHRSNILGPFDAAGVAIAHSGDGRIWAVEEFGRHR